MSEDFDWIIRHFENNHKTFEFAYLWTDNLSDYFWTSHQTPADTRRNSNVIMMSKRRRFDVIMTLLLRRVPVATFCRINGQCLMGRWLFVNTVRYGKFDDWEPCSAVILMSYQWSFKNPQMRQSITIVCYSHVFNNFSVLCWPSSARLVAVIGLTTKNTVLCDIGLQISNAIPGFSQTGIPDCSDRNYPSPCAHGGG